jgi:sugar phosphate isomerase/epimerase
MTLSPSRRQFLQATSVAAACTCLPRIASAEDQVSSEGPFKISLAEWSLHRTLKDNTTEITNLDFPRVAKEEFGIDAIEYVNQFFKDKAKDSSYLAELNKRCSDHGVKSLLIMVDGEGQLGDPKAEARKSSVENHHKWVDAAKELGCHSIRVNAGSKGTYDEQQKLAADGLHSLSEYAAPMGLNVIVENHGGLSSNGEWLAGVIKMVGMNNCGTLPDFGNFWISRDPAEWYDNYKGVDELMPFAKAVSAKMYDFDDESDDESYTTHGVDRFGNKSEIDYEKMMEIVLSHGYHGYVGIEYEGDDEDEYAGIRESKDLLERVAAKLGKTATAG